MTILAKPSPSEIKIASVLRNVDSFCLCKFIRTESFFQNKVCVIFKCRTGLVFTPDMLLLEFTKGKGLLEEKSTCADGSVRS